MTLRVEADHCIPLFPLLCFFITFLYVCVGLCVCLFCLLCVFSEYPFKSGVLFLYFLVYVLVLVCVCVCVCVFILSVCVMCV